MTPPHDSPGSQRPLAYTVPQAAEALNVSPSKIYKMIRSGELRAVHFGRALRIPAWALDQLLETPGSGEAEGVAE